MNLVISEFFPEKQLILSGMMIAAVAEVLYGRYNSVSLFLQ